MSGAVKKIFGGGKAPKIEQPKPIETPQVDDAQETVEEKKRRRFSSRNANQLVKAEGGVSTAARALTGN